MPPPATPTLATPLARLVQQTLSQALHAAATAPADSPPLRVPAATSALGLQLLAAHHPPGGAARREALSLYTRCLQHYRHRLQPQLSPGHGGDDDLGAALAFFTLANLAALDGSEPDAQALPAVERQLRQLLGCTAAWARLPLAERQQGFEQLAALGVLVNESRVAARTQGAAAQARLRQAAGSYLQQLLGLDAQRLRVSPAGLAWADAVH